MTEPEVGASATADLGRARKRLTTNAQVFCAIGLLLAGAQLKLHSPAQLGQDRQGSIRDDRGANVSTLARLRPTLHVQTALLLRYPDGERKSN